MTDLEKLLEENKRLKAELVQLRQYTAYTGDKIREAYELGKNAKLAELIEMLETKRQACLAIRRNNDLADYLESVLFDIIEELQPPNQLTDGK